MARVGLWGMFDVESLGDVLSGRLIGAELRRRDANIQIDARSPLGYVGLNRFTEPDPDDPFDHDAVSSLGAWSEARAAELGTGLDALVIVGATLHDRDEEMAAAYGLGPLDMVVRAPHRFFVEGVGAITEVDVPTAWHAVKVPSAPSGDLAERIVTAGRLHRLVTTRDAASAANLAAVGLSDVEVAPDVLVLLPRYVPTELIARRVEQLRASQRLPAGLFIAIQADGALIHWVDQMADSLAAVCASRGLAPVVVETASILGDDVMAAGLAKRLPDAMRLGTANALDVLAVIGAAEAVVGSSPPAITLAAAFDRPGVQLHLDGRGGPADVGTTPVADAATIAATVQDALDRGSTSANVERLQDVADRYLDQLASIVPAGSRTGPPAPLEAVDLPASTDLDAGSRSAAMRIRLADHLAAIGAGQAGAAVQGGGVVDLVRRQSEEIAWLRGVVRDRERAAEGQAEEIAWLRDRAERAEAELAALRNTLAGKVGARLSKRGREGTR